MRTPDGRECPFYTADAHRRSATRETCHLLAGKPDAVVWTSSLCSTCPVPDIKQANRCPDMVLQARIESRAWRFWEKPHMGVDADCMKTRGHVENPMVGCGHCHETLTFIVSEEESEDG